MHPHNRHGEQGPSDHDVEKYRLAQELAKELFSEKLDPARDYFSELEEFCSSRGFAVDVSYKQGKNFKECAITVSFSQFGLPPIVHAERDKSLSVAKNRAAKKLYDQLEQDLHSS
ncbi:hypothetical protein HY622_00180 [Candidatus Uhrbacteria bacterium]|nr:hypothetical protein [Candidatus Uhrbacteria bacterium]